MNNDQQPSENSGINTQESTTPLTRTPPAPLSTQTTQPKDRAKTSLLVATVATVFGLGAIAGLVVVGSGASKTKSDLLALNESFKKLEETNNAAKNNNDDKVNKDGYQAVFLDNGQVYFGKIESINNTQITLTNIYYLRVNQGVTSSQLNDPNGLNDVSLVKLGNELHGPEDVMYIERKEASFWENLKDDSQVVKAIKEYEKSNR